MFGALIRAADRWRGLHFTEFELRQIAASEKELDQEYEASIDFGARIGPWRSFKEFRDR